MEQLGKAAEQVLKHIKQRPMMNGDQIVIGFIESVREIAQRGDTTPALDRVEEALRQIQRDMINGFKQIQKDTEDIRQRVSIIEKQASINIAPTTTNSSSFWQTHYATNWQQNFHAAQPLLTKPSSRQPGMSEKDSQGVPPEDLARDSEITVKVREDSIRNQLCSLKPSAIIAKAERARETAARKASGADLAGTAFLAVKQLPSGDLCFRARSASGAEVLRRHADAWVQAFGKTAYVRMPTWGVVAHGIPVASICKDGADITSTVGHEVAAQLVAANQHT
jgi:hypothetical protein